MAIKAQATVNHKRILVVEDEAITAEDIKVIVAGLGYEIAAVVDTGEEAVRIAGAKKPDLAILDIKLKGRMDGIEAARQIRQFGVPVIYLTGYGDHETMTRAIKAAPYAFVHKPFGEKDLDSAITLALHQSAADKRSREGEERFRIIFEYAPDAIYVNDLSGNFIDGNKAAEGIIGCKKEELIGQSFLKLNLLSKGDMLRAATLLARNALGKPTGPDDFTLTRRDGTRVIVAIRTFPAIIAGKKVVFGMARDVSARYSAMQKIEKTNAELEKANKLMVGRELRMIELKKRIQELEKKLNDAREGGHDPSKRQR